MALIIAEALVPVFFVMFLGYFAGARRIIDNQHVASLNALLMTFALPVRKSPAFLSKCALKRARPTSQSSASA